MLARAAFALALLPSPIASATATDDPRLPWERWLHIGLFAVFVGAGIVLVAAWRRRRQIRRAQAAARDRNSAV